jgi:hypothetical protein
LSKDPTNSTNSTEHHQLAKAVLSQLMGDSQLLLPSDQLLTSAPSPLIRYGLIGANGNVSSLLQREDSFWARSGTLTATLQLAILALLEGCFGDEAAPLRSFYSVSLDGPTLKPASLSLISKFWQDPLPSLQHCARLIFSSSLNRLNERELRVLVAYWKDLLPCSSSTSMTRSTIILSIIALQSSCNDLPLKQLADSLVHLLVQEEKRSLFRLAGVELIGRGYEGLWRPFIHGKSIFRMLFNWYRTFNVNVNANANVIPTTQYVSAQAQSNSSSQESILKTTLLNILSAEPDLLVKLLSDAFAASPQSAAILLQELLNSRPLLLMGREREVMEVVLVGCKSEEAALLMVVKRMTECFGTVASNGRFLAVSNSRGVDSGGGGSVRSMEISNVERSNSKTPPSTASQSITESSSTYQILIFDLKTKSKTATLAGHSAAHPCTLLHFHPSRSVLLLSYSASEATVRWWPLSASGAALNSTSSTASTLFFGPGVLDSGSVGQSAKMLVVDPKLTRAVDRLPSGCVFGMRPVQGRSAGEEVHLIVAEQVLMTFKV